MIHCLIHSIKERVGAEVNRTFSKEECPETTTHKFISTWTSIKSAIVNIIGKEIPKTIQNLKYNRKKREANIKTKYSRI